MKAGYLLPLVLLAALLAACAAPVDNRQWEAKRNIIAIEGSHARGLVGPGIVDCIVTTASYVELSAMITANSRGAVDRAVAPVIARAEYNACLSRLYAVPAAAADA